MSPIRNSVWRALVLLSLSAGTLPAADPPSPAEAVSEPLRDDATLNDVQWMGSRRAWAVGNLGVCKQSTDGGETWSTVPVPTNGTLYDVCALTDRDVWIVGSEAVPHTPFRRGVLFVSHDGGRTWQQPSKQTLPSLYRVCFFDRSIGIVVGEPSSSAASGVLKTTDGGATWIEVSGPAGSWRAADFVHPEVGMVAGRNGRLAMLGGARLIQGTADLRSLKTIHDVALDQDDHGWMVGDGGLVLRTSTGGVVWETVTEALPEAIADLNDFRSVSHVGNRVWIAGAPGSVVWHSADGGDTWTAQPTGSTVPLNAVHFRSETEGLAVGECGQILRTLDGGETWMPLHGANRHAALMAIQLRPNQTPVRLLTQYALDDGFRSVSVTVGRPDEIAGGTADSPNTAPHADALGQIGVNAIEQWWRLPLVLPDVDSDTEALWDEWNRWTEGRLNDLLVGGLVREIRTWRPDVIVLPFAEPDDAATELLDRAVRTAVVAAGDSTRFMEQPRETDLRPWKVKKVFRRLSPGSSGQIRINSDEWLSRSQTSVRAATSPVMASLSLDALATDETFRLVWDGRTDSLAHPGDPFAGLWHPPDSEARRAVLDKADQQQGESLAQRIRHFNSYAFKVLNDPRQSLGWLAQLDETLRGLDREWAAVELAHLARMHREQGHWELAEQTYIELIARFPDEPAAHEGMTWLLSLWTSEEATWRRRKDRGTRQESIAFDKDAVEEISKAAFQGTADEEQIAPTVNYARGIGSLAEESGETHTAMVQRWQEQASKLIAVIEKESPELYERPEIQFPLAALRRHRGSFGKADEIYRSTRLSQQKNAWTELAEAELWLAHPVNLPPRPVAHCIKAEERPHLDGKLSDVCWQMAKPVRLNTGGDDNDTDAIVMCCYDEQFLYIAASMPRDREEPLPEVIRGGRQYDVDLTGQDRLRMLIDIDRDYTTAYEMIVDHRGQTNDACWSDPRWNPRWYVDVAGEPDMWRIEAAIPFRELLDRAPRKGQAWSIAFERLIPAVGRQHWPPADSSHTATPRSAGLLRFE